MSGPDDCWWSSRVLRPSERRKADEIVCNDCAPRRAKWRKIDEDVNQEFSQTAPLAGLKGAQSGRFGYECCDMFLGL
jgi:hypothetical protein